VKYVVLVPDGAADYAQDSLSGQTPLQAASTPNMDRLAAGGTNGLVQIIPEGRPPGSDVGNLEIFGYDSLVHHTGRAPLEAASMGVELGTEDVAYRCNLIHADGDTLVDYSAGHISTEEGQALVGELALRLNSQRARLHPGVQYRHLLVMESGPEGLTTYPPHDIMGQSVEAHLPSGDGAERICDLMAAAAPILADAGVNRARDAAGKLTANQIWLWGAGRALQLESLEKRFGIRGGVISAVDLVRGIGLSAGMEVITVPGITGYLDTNYQGKAGYALDALERLDLVYVHVEAPDEAAHNGDLKAKIQALEDFDRAIAGPIVEAASVWDGYRVLMAPDHRTPIQLRTHSAEPVPFVLWGTGIAADQVQTFDEMAAAHGALPLDRGCRMLDHLVAASTPE
jgi:2,3-bisphosphoglycerate-independent phosphoglycerate mutase